ncbi:MAG: ABC transporter, partial [Burkholderiaceae bacterium]
MTTDNLASDISHNEIPAEWRAEVGSRLDTGENVITAVEVDLDAKLHFVKGLVVVTNKRILARAPGETIWRDWTYRKGLQLKHHDHAGVGHLEIVDQTGRLASWRFTLGQNLLAIRLIDQFALQLESHVTGLPPVQEDQNVCPSCKAPLEPDQDECPVCTKV